MIVSSLVAVLSLSLGNPATGTLAAGETSVHTVTIPPQTAARITIAQSGINVVARLRAPGSKDIADSSDMSFGVRGDELLLVPIGDVETTWEVHIEPALPRPDSGSYTATLHLGPADHDAMNLAAARARQRKGRAGHGSGNGDAIAAAVDEYLAAADVYLQLGERVLASYTIFEAARALDLLGDFPRAIATQHRALAVATEIGDSDKRARILNRLGDMSRKIGAVSDAEQFFSEALPLARAAGDEPTTVDILNNSGLLMSSLSRWEEALEQLENAVPLAQKIESLDVESALHHNIGQAWARLGEKQRAIAAYERSLDLKRRMGSARRTARTLEAVSSVRFSAGEHERATADVRQSLALFEGAGDRAGVATSLTLLGRMLSGADDAAALAAFTRALPIAREIKDRKQEAQILIDWSEIDLRQDKFDDAVTKAGTAAALNRLIENKPGEADALYTQARALKAAGRAAEARIAIDEALRIVETMRAGIARGDLRSSYLATVRSYYDFSISLLLSADNAEATSQSFAVSERARAQTLLVGLAESAARIRKGADAKLLERERTLRAELSAREAYRARVISRSGPQSERARELVTEVNRLLEEWRETQAAIRASSPRYAALAMPDSVNIAELRSFLDPGTAIVAYRLGAERSHAWVFDRARITVHELPAMSVIDGVARRYHQLLGRERSSLSVAERTTVDRQMAVEARRLSTAVYAPLASRVRGKRLLIVADGALHYVPFAALPANGAPLLASHEIVYLPSASVLPLLRRNRNVTPTEARVAVFADPVFTRDDPRLGGRATTNAVSRAEERWQKGSYARLRFSRQEATAITDAASRARTFTALDFQAAKQNLLSRDLRGYDILHFATHGTLNTTQPELSGLVFSLFDQSGRRVDGFLRLHEIYNLDLDAALVVLSACRTALGKEAHGEGLIGLTRGFMYAGAPRVVSSVWNVDDRASALLMTRFYEQIYEKKLAPSAALRAAQLSMLAEPRWQNAHYWAAFALHGDWR